MYTFLVKTLLIPQTFAARDGFIEGLDEVNPLGEGASLVDIIGNIFDWLVALAAMIMPLIIIWGAFQILTSNGEAEKLKSGKSAILYSVIGFIVILMAEGIVKIVQSILTSKF